LILLAVLSVVGIVFRLLSWRTPSGGETAEYEFLAKWEGVNRETLACLDEGERLYTAAGEYFGQVVSVRTEAAEITLTDGGITYRGAAPESVCNVILTVRTRGAFRDGVFFRDGRRILGLGESYLLYGGRTQLTLRIVRMPQGEEIP
jgi:hypothetical protein